MSLVLDAGTPIAVERGSRALLASIKRERLVGRVPVTHGGVVGQVWRAGSGQQAGLAQMLPHIEIVSLGGDLGKGAGTLLRETGGSDVIAAVVLLAGDDDLILTSDPADLVALAAVSGIHVEIVPV
jgi:hypothetical protein